MNHQVFISHAEEDRGTAARTQAALEQAGVRCWIAYRDLPPGVTWTEKIIEAISGSRVMVLLVSRAANSSQYVIREVGAAVDAQGAYHHGPDRSRRTVQGSKVPHRMRHSAAHSRVTADRTATRNPGG